MRLGDSEENLTVGTQTKERQCEMIYVPFLGHFIVLMVKNTELTSFKITSTVNNLDRNCLKQ